MDRLAGLMSTTTGDELDGAIDQYSELHERFVHAGGYELDATAEQIATGVGLDADTLLTPVGALSGGQRRKLDLAGLLLAGGDLFILDKPTNHLDVSAKKWVMNFLGQTEATVLVVSHDVKLMELRPFDRVLALENAQIDSYRGTYSDSCGSAPRTRPSAPTRPRASAARRRASRRRRCSPRATPPTPPSGARCSDASTPSTSA